MSNALRLGSFMVAARVERGEPEQVYVLASDYDALAARLADEQARSGDRLVELTQAQARLAEAVAAAKTWENEAERRSRRYEQAAVRLAEAERLIRRAYGALGTLRRMADEPTSRQSYSDWQDEADSWLKGTTDSAEVAPDLFQSMGLPTVALPGEPK